MGCSLKGTKKKLWTSLCLNINVSPNPPLPAQLLVPMEESDRPGNWNTNLLSSIVKPQEERLWKAFYIYSLYWVNWQQKLNLLAKLKLPRMAEVHTCSDPFSLHLETNAGCYATEILCLFLWVRQRRLSVLRYGNACSTEWGSHKGAQGGKERI